LRGEKERVSHFFTKGGDGLIFLFCEEKERGQKDTRPRAHRHQEGKNIIREEGETKRALRRGKRKDTRGGYAPEERMQTFVGRSLHYGKEKKRTRRPPARGKKRFPLFQREPGRFSSPKDRRYQKGVTSPLYIIRKKGVLAWGRGRNARPPEGRRKIYHYPEKNGI